MTIKVGVRELARNSNILTGHDYIDVEDKKTHEYKGLFVSADHADMVKKFLDKKIIQKQQHELDEVLQFAGIADGDSNNMSAKEMRAAHASKYGTE
jgi:hypothetical protein